ncbi:MAG TPA: DUF2768 family protein [Bacillota bacterium]|nr:DUF2768 family protein [Bacillota bacterium]
MDKEMSSIIAILLMFIANFTIVFARRKLNGFARVLVATIAFLLLVPSFLLILVVLL